MPAQLARQRECPDGAVRPRCTAAVVATVRPPVVRGGRTLFGFGHLGIAVAVGHTARQLPEAAAPILDTSWLSKISRNPKGLISEEF
jgi:hypothetical protein